MLRQNCAIYTRKSSEEGLDQGFNSLDAQREACEAYIASQKHEGWWTLPDMYDDGGLSGGTMERPALRRLLSDIKVGRVQVVVVYKVDRLTRSLVDFSKIVDIFDSHRASFVSVTQQFNTTTSMGRLTLNMLLSFAQFEREIAGERIRDKIAASKAKGMWMGGIVPLGYDVRDRKLIVNPVEAETVRFIFRRYAELGSVLLLRSELDRQGIVSKKRGHDDHQTSGGAKFSRGALYLMLQNRLYRGEVTHKGNIYAGQHEAIIDDALWHSAQRKLVEHRRERGATAESPSLLAGLIVDQGGRRLTPTHAIKQGRRYRYYVSTTQQEGHHTGAGTMRIPAREIEGLVLDRLRALLGSRSEVAAALSLLELDAAALNHALRRAVEFGARWTTVQPNEQRQLIRTVIQGVVVKPDRIEISIGTVALAKVLDGSPTVTLKDVAPVTLSVEAQLRRVGKGQRIVIEGNTPHSANDGLVRLLQEAFSARAGLLGDSNETLNAMTARLGLAKGHLTWLMRLTYLSPDIISAIVAGNQPLGLTPRRLLRMSQGLPHAWSEQRAYLGFKD